MYPHAQQQQQQQRPDSGLRPTKPTRQRPAQAGSLRQAGPTTVSQLAETLPSHLLHELSGIKESHPPTSPPVQAPRSLPQSSDAQSSTSPSIVSYQGQGTGSIVAASFLLSLPLHLPPFFSPSRLSRWDVHTTSQLESLECFSVISCL